MNRNQRIRVVKTLGELPHNSLVTKKGGTKEYRTVNEVRIFSPRGLIKRIAPDPGTVLLMTPGSMDFNVESADTEVLWITTLAELQAQMKAFNHDGPDFD